MHIKLTSFLNFRNLEDSTVKFSNGINLFHGKNGQGKTSLLEAVYFNATGKSFRTKLLKDIQRYNSDNYGVYSEYSDIYGERNIATTVKIGKKSFFYNNNHWYLYIIDKTNQQTTRFYVAEHGAVKVINNGRHEELLTSEEIQNLSLSTKLYKQKIDEEIYSEFVLAA